MFISISAAATHSNHSFKPQTPPQQPLSVALFLFLLHCIPFPERESTVQHHVLPYNSLTLPLRIKPHVCSPASASVHFNLLSSQFPSYFSSSSTSSSFSSSGLLHLLFLSPRKSLSIRDLCRDGSFPSWMFWLKYCLPIKLSLSPFPPYCTCSFII